MLTRISYPLRVENGRLALSQGVDAAREALHMLMNIHSGELPLSRDYGADLDYNVPLSVAFAAEERLSELIGKYHPHLSLDSMTPVLGEDGTVLDWAAQVSVQEEA